MKITKEQLKKLIVEELREMERVPVPLNDPFGSDQTKEIKSHLRALKKIFDEVGLKSVPDEMKRGLSKIRTALDDIPGLKEELEEITGEGYIKRYTAAKASKGRNLIGRNNFILLMKPNGETLSDLRYYRIQSEDAPRHPDSSVQGIVYFVMRGGQKVYLPERNGLLNAPSPTTDGEVIGHSEPMEQGEKIPLGRASASVGKMIKNTPSPEQMGQP